MLGMKTGFIRASGFNVMIAAQRGEKRLFGVVMGGASSRARDARAGALLDAAWARASVRAPAMTAHLPQRNPAFRSSERERAIRKRLARADGPPEAMLFKHLETAAPVHARRTPPQHGRKKIQARLSSSRAPQPQAQPRGSAVAQSLAGPYHVQVGAYVSPEDARARLRSVSAKANALLGSHPHDALPAEVGGREVFRARFGGFNKVRARETCDTLKQRAVDCLVMAAN
jgi:D-alanyl-D-alanine carboxypeptidase